MQKTLTFSFIKKLQQTFYSRRVEFLAFDAELSGRMSGNGTCVFHYVSVLFFSYFRKQGLVLFGYVNPVFCPIFFARDLILS